RDPFRGRAPVIYLQPPVDARVDQVDIIAKCPLLSPTGFDLDNPDPLAVKYSFNWVVVLTQSCDLANQRSSTAIVAVALPAQDLVDQKVLKAADIRGPVRAGRVFGWYFLPKSEALGLPELVVDFRQLHTVQLDLLVALSQRGQRPARIQPLYREHLAKHFADTYSRIGLPEPYATE